MSRPRRVDPSHVVDDLAQLGARWGVRSGLRELLESAERYNAVPCDAERFRALSEQAVEVYERHPEQGEVIGQFMAGIWF